ncbi:DUF3387 domain-containing protein [Sphingobacteriaceae bacterium WQ 2009]|uniref:DUF3387 domain-containing protein n=1 Tax=Rhinopithecimicrobium faecis TaxID=2820698 RepID=A0A8T4HBX5_9SPHI|nr:DUF3387 domain-containing protein [Sphingobacteriaceae bacterium WQ 2009]
MRIPDLILYINGIPVVVFEFKTAIEEEITIHDTYKLTEDSERFFVNVTKKLKSSYNLVSGSELFTRKEVDEIHFYFAIKSIVVKLTRGEVPDTAEQMLDLIIKLRSEMASFKMDIIVKLHQ